MFLISRSIYDSKRSAATSNGLLLFAGSLQLCIVVNILFYKYLIQIATTFVFDIESKIVKQLRDASFTDVNGLAKEEVYTAIENLSTIGYAPNRFINIFNSMLTLVGCLCYLFFVSAIYGSIMILLVPIIMGTFLVGNKLREKNILRFVILKIVIIVTSMIF